VSEQGPPASIVFTLDEALQLLADLEDARETLIEGDLWSGVIALEAQIRVLNRKLGFDHPGDSDVS
jgi:hypothetical protein